MPQPTRFASALTAALALFPMAACDGVVESEPRAPGTIVFLRSVDSTFMNPGDVYVVRADGTGLRNLTNAPGDYTPPQVSPDGRSVLVSHRGDDEMWIVNTDGTGMRRIGEGARPVWSPGGTRIAFEMDRHVYVANADGSQPVNVTQPTGGGSCTSADDIAFHLQRWRRDGTLKLWKYVRCEGYRFYLADADGGGLERVDWAEFAAIPSPDGTQFLEQDEIRGEVFVANTDGSGGRLLNPPDTRMLVTLEFPWSEADPWSPDGERIVVYVADFGESESGCSGSPVRPYVIDADGSDLRRLVDECARFGGWSPSGDQLLFTVGDLEAGSDIYVVNADGTGLTNLTRSPDAESRPSWLPDS